MIIPEVPAGSGQHPIPLVVIAAHDLKASTAFYATLFGWRFTPVTPELVAGALPAGPMASLRSNVPPGLPGVVPFIGVPDVGAALTRVAAAGGAVEHEPWALPGVGTMARFTDPSGTVYGLTTARPPGPVPRALPPFGPNPKPPVGTVCSLEMYAADGTAAARFFGDLFGWGAAETMPQYTMFDPGVGVGGVFQTHTPATPAVAYLYVVDVAATVRDIEAAGGKRLCDPMPMPGFGTFGYFTDPSGTSMGLIGP